MQTCQRCDRAFTRSEDSQEILRAWYVHLRDEHGDNIGTEFLARGRAEEVSNVRATPDDIERLLREDLPRARKLWG